MSLIQYNFEVINPEEAHRGGSISFFCKIDFIESDNNNNFNIQITFNVKGFREDGDLFKLEEKFNAVFTKVNAKVFDNVSNKLQVKFCVSLLYPTIRENALYTLSKAGLGQINIPFQMPNVDIEAAD